MSAHSNRATSEPVSISQRLGRLQFHRSGKFRVMQVADIQDGAKISKDTVALIAAACDAVRPDLVVFTGNQIAGYAPEFEATYRRRRWAAPQDGVYVPSGDGWRVVSRKADGGDRILVARTRALVAKQARQFLQPLIDRRIPFAITYGNHDFQCGLDTAELDGIYRSFPGCLNPAAPIAAGVTGRAVAPDSSNAASAPIPEAVPVVGLDRQIAYPCEPGTFALPVASEDGKETAAGLVLLDSGDYAPGGGYGSPSTKAMDWLRRLPSAMAAKSLVFQHFPMPQMYRLMREVPAGTAYAIQGYRSFDRHWYVLDADKTQPGGYLGEGVSCPDEDVGEFAALRDSGGYIGVVAAHDHRNAYVGLEQGLMLGATPTSGFGSYGLPASQRAVRYFEFDQRHPDKPRTVLLEFGDIAGHASSRSVYTFAMSRMPPSEGAPPARSVDFPTKVGGRRIDAGGCREAAAEQQDVPRLTLMAELLATLSDSLDTKRRRRRGSRTGK